jgi:hypothetical protein
MKLCAVCGKRHHDGCCTGCRNHRKDGPKAGPCAVLPDWLQDLAIPIGPITDDIQRSAEIIKRGRRRTE